MPRFLKNIFLFAIPVILFLVGLEVYMRAMPNEYRYKAQWMERNIDSVETVILGSSKAYYGFRPDCFSSNAFNLATVSGRPDYDYEVLTKYAGKAKRLKTVIYPVFYELFFDPPFEECVEWPRAGYYQIYWDCHRHPLVSKYSLEIASFFAVKTKLAEYAYYNGETCDSLGYGLQTNTKYMNADESAANLEILKSLMRHKAEDFRYEDYNYSYLEKMAQLCRQNHLRLILVAMPCKKDYTSRLDTAQNNEYHRLTQKLVNRYSLEFHDFTNYPDFIDSDFFDSNHLNENGAKKLSLIVNELI
jgi:hypothetical protein